MIDTGEIEVVGVNLSQCHFVYHKSHMAWPVMEPLPRGNSRQPNAWTLARPF